MYLDDHVGEVIRKHLSHQAAQILIFIHEHSVLLYDFFHLIMSLEPDDKKEQGRYVDGEDATDQGPDQGHLKHQLGPALEGAEEDLVHGVLGQLVLVLLVVINLLWIQSHKVLVVLGHAHPHVASLPIERKPFHIVDTPPEVSVLLSADNLVLRSSELICTVGSARVSHSWGDVQISGNGV